MSDRLIGASITLIAINDIRYDGVLFSVNTAESKIVLKDVHILGTEDRVTDPTKKVAATAIVLPFVTFPGSEIKDLWVHTTGQPAAQPAAVPEPPATTVKPTPAPAAAPTPAPAPAPSAKPVAAPATTTAKPSPNPKPETKAAVPAAAPAPSPAPAPAAAPKPAAAAPTSVETTTKPDQRPRRRERALPGTGSHLIHLRPRGGTGEVDLGGDFDIQAGLQQFDKDAEISKLNEGLTSVKLGQNSQAYTKGDFFDSISSDLTDQEAGAKRLSGQEERRLNQETFGAVALQSGYRGRGRGRGRRGGRGGRGYSGEQQHTGEGTQQRQGDRAASGNSYNDTRGRGRGRRGRGGRGQQQVVAENA